MRLALVLPGVAIGFVAVVILGPGNARPVLGARVYASTVAGEPTRSARIGVVWSDGGSTEPHAPGVALSVRAGASDLHLDSGPDGVIEVTFDPPLPPNAEVVVHAGDAELARAELDRREEATWRETLAPAPDAARGSDAIRFEVAPLRGQLVPSFSEAVVVRVARAVEGGATLPLPRTHVVVDLVGGSPARTELDLEGERDAAVLDVQADAMRVDFELRATDAQGREGSLAGSLPMVPGAVWLAPRKADGRFELVSSAPRAVAHVSFWGEHGRVGGAQIPLQESPDGFHRGAFTRSAGLAAEATTIVVAGDVGERGTSTVVWPLETRAAATSTAPSWHTSDGSHPRLRVVGDGVRAALDRESARVKRVRGMAVGVAIVVGLLELLLLVRDGRRAQRVLDAHFAAQAAAADEAADGASAAAAIRGVATDAARRGSVTVTILGAMIALAFGIVAAFVVAR